MKYVDARGKACPMPLIMTKKALNETAENDTLQIIIDNETSVKNVSRFLEEHKVKVATDKKGADYILTVSKTGFIPQDVKPEEYCEPSSTENSNYVIAFQKDMLGSGVDELGRLLMKAFINTIPEINKKPATLVFLNSGIFLALKDSPVLEALEKLEKEEISILVCGTCLDYYNKKHELGVGIVSNMLDILTTISNAGKVLYP